VNWLVAPSAASRWPERGLRPSHEAGSYHSRRISRVTRRSRTKESRLSLVCGEFNVWWLPTPLVGERTHVPCGESQLLSLSVMRVGWGGLRLLSASQTAAPFPHPCPGCLVLRADECGQASGRNVPKCRANNVAKLVFVCTKSDDKTKSLTTAENWFFYRRAGWFPESHSTDRQANSQVTWSQVSCLAS